MRRRVARVLRIAMLSLGIGLLLSLPASFLYGAHAQTPLTERSGLGASVERGVLVVVYLYTDAYPMSLGFDVGPAEPNPFIGGQLWPEVLRERAQGLHLFAIAIPLWLLAFICLAWPVTSFILARRRHKRGFPVEPTAGGEAVSPRASSS